MMLKQWIEAVEMKIMMCICGFVEEERGDTNFISILIVMGIVILLAGLFIGFKDQIVAQVQEIVSGFTIS